MKKSREIPYHLKKVKSGLHCRERKHFEKKNNKHFIGSLLW